MHELVEFAIEAHGGLARWQALRNIKINASIGGLLFDLKGQSETFKNIDIEVDCERVRTIYKPFGGPGCHGLFEPNNVAIMRGTEVMQARSDPRAAFEEMTPETPWDYLHALYFGGYAMWNYVAVPFIFASPGFQVSEGEPWQEGGEVWRCLNVAFSENVPTHCPQLKFYFGSDGLLRRMDYHVEIVNVAVLVAHYCFDYADIDGIMIPQRRRALPRDEKGKSSKEPLYVGIDIHSVSIT